MIVGFAGMLRGGNTDELDYCGIKSISFQVTRLRRACLFMETFYWVYIQIFYYVQGEIPAS